MPFLPPNQQRQSAEGTSSVTAFSAEIPPDLLVHGVLWRRQLHVACVSVHNAHAYTVLCVFFSPSTRMHRR